MDITTSHKVFGISRDSSIDEVKQVYRDLVFVWHPDRIPQGNERLKEVANEKIKEINNAYDILCEYYRSIHSKGSVIHQTKNASTQHQNETSQINSAPNQLRSTPYYDIKKQFPNLLSEWSKACKNNSIPVYWKELKNYNGQFSLFDYQMMKIFNLDNRLWLKNFIENQFVYNANDTNSNFIYNVKVGGRDFVYNVEDTVTDFSTGLMWTVANFETARNTGGLYKFIISPIRGNPNLYTEKHNVFSLHL